MQKIILSLLITFSFGPLSFARDKVLIAGDSWSFLPCVFGSAQKAFWEKKMDADILDCHLTAEAGVRAATFKTRKPHKWIKKLLKNRNDIKAIYFSLGGNDLLRFWNKDMSPEEELALFTEIRDHVSSVIDDFHKIQPKVKILVTGYDYGYFVPNHKISAYARAYRRMGLPSTLELHSGFIRFSDFMAELRHKPNVAYIHHYGLMHYYYGVPEKGLPAGTTLPPGEISPLEDPTQVGGMADARAPLAAMLKIGKYLTDAFHLDKVGFQKLIEHAIDKYLKTWVQN
jgi:hypothetical protein